MSIDIHIHDTYIRSPWSLVLLALLIVVVLGAVIAAGEMLYRWLVPGRSSESERRPGVRS
jgi:hypothetical protein